MFLSHKTPCFPCNIAITNFLVLHMCEIRFHDVIDRTVCIFTSRRHPTQKFQIHGKLAKGSLNNIFQDSFNKTLSQQLTHDRSYVSIKNEVKREMFRFEQFFLFHQCFRKSLWSQLWIVSMINPIPCATN